MKAAARCAYCPECIIDAFGQLTGEAHIRPLRDIISTGLRHLFLLEDREGARLLAMEGLRGFAVTLIFLVHFVALSAPYVPARLSGAVHALGLLSNVGVELFFAVSGYLIYGSLMRRPRPYTGFMLRRIRRLYPTFLVVLAIYISISFLLPSQSKLPNGAGSSLTYVVQNVLLLPGMFKIRPIIVVAWSLSYEMFFYLCAPLVVWALRLGAWRPWVRIGFFLACVVLAQLLRLPHERLAMFACGMVVYELIALPKPRPFCIAALDAAAVVSAVTYILVALRGAVPMLYFGCLFVATLLTCLAAFAGPGIVARVLETPFLRWLGNISYSYYLIHALVLNVVFFVLQRLQLGAEYNALVFWTALPLSFLLTLMVSAGLYLLVERPLSIVPEKNRSRSLQTSNTAAATLNTADTRRSSIADNA